MLERFFLWFVSFFGILSVIGIYLGYFHLIYGFVSVFVILISCVVSYFLAKRIPQTESKHSKKIVMIILFLLLLDMYVSLPYMIYPHSYVDFGLNVAQGRLVAQAHGFPDFIHVYPNVYYGVFAIFDSISPHAYSVSSMIAIVMQAMTVLAIFLIGKSIFDEKAGIVAAFLYGFSLINIHLLEQGYLTQNFATFFFVSAMYLVIMVSKGRSYNFPLILSLAGLVSYPHYFAIMAVVILLYFRKLSKYLLLALVLLAPEITGMILHYFTHTATLLNSLVMYGGIIVPNLFVMSIFAFALIAYRKLAADRTAAVIVSFTNGILLVISGFLVLFFVNYLVLPVSPIAGRDTRQLYIVVKLLYLLFVPASIFAGYLIMKSGKRWSMITGIFLLMYLIFFAGYIMILPAKNNLSSEFYFMSEQLSEMASHNKIGFDYCMMDNRWIQPWIYDTLYGRPDNYTEFSIAEPQFLLQSSFVRDTVEDHYRTGGGLNISYSSDNVSYFATTCNYPTDNRFGLYNSFGKMRVYTVSQRV